MIANISPAQASAAETHNTLDFATRAKCVKNRVRGFSFAAPVSHAGAMCFGRTNRSLMQHGITGCIHHDMSACCSRTTKAVKPVDQDACAVQAVRNEVVAADAAFLQKEVERLTGELAEARGGAAETIALRAELAAASSAGSHLAEELAVAESAVRATQVPGHVIAQRTCQQCACMLSISGQMFKAHHCMLGTRTMLSQCLSRRRSQMHALRRLHVGCCPSYRRYILRDTAGSAGGGAARGGAAARGGPGGGAAGTAGGRGAHRPPARGGARRRGRGCRPPGIDHQNRGSQAILRLR